MNSDVQPRASERTRTARFGPELRTLLGPDFDDACSKLMRLAEADFSPNLLVGIKNGGFVVAKTMARFAAGVPPVMPLTSRRATTGTKSRLPMLRTMLLALPVSARDLLRRVEHRYITASRARAGRQQYVDQAEANAIRQRLQTCAEPRRVLVVDDAVDSGVTLAAVMQVLRDIAPPDTQIRAAVITQTLDDPTVRPDYALHTTARYADFLGRSMPRHELPPVLVFDLDGTILRDNSFPLWVVHLISGRLPGLQLRQRLILSLRSQSALLRRKLRRTSHAEFLRELQHAWLAATGPRSTMLAERFECTLLRRVRPNLNATLAWLRAERPDAILATAAAVEYAEGLGRRLGFHHIVATPSARQKGEPCNSGACKRDRVLQLLNDLGWESRPLILFTDHPDDLPLICDSRTVYWFGSPALLSRVTEAAPNACLIACRALDCETLCDMLRADCAASGNDNADQLANPRAMTVS